MEVTCTRNISSRKLKNTVIRNGGSKIIYYMTMSTSDTNGFWKLINHNKKRIKEYCNHCQSYIYILKYKIKHTAVYQF